MDTTNSNETPGRRVEDRKPNAKIDWTAPGAPAVPMAAAAAAAPVAVFEGYDGDTGAPIFKLLGTVEPGARLYRTAPAATSGDAPDLQSEVRSLVRAIMANLEDRRGVLEDIDDDVMEEIRDSLAQNILDSALIARIESAAAPVDTGGTMLGVGDGSGKLFVRGDYDSIKAVQSIIFENERLRSAAPATASGDELPSVRARFEAWASKEMYVLDWDSEGFYCNGDTESAWEGWQARAAVSAATKPTADLSVKVERNRVWIVKGSQSFMLAISDDNAEELNWYADRLRDALGIFTSGVKAESLATKPAAAPAVLESKLESAIRQLAELRREEPLVTRKSALAAIDHVRMSNAPGRAAEASAMLAATPAASTTGAAEAPKDIDYLAGAHDLGLEQAAGFVEDLTADGRVLTFTEIAMGIRALKRPTPTHSSEAGE